MTEKISNRREQLQQKPSQEIIRTHEISWHALRGYDFAGLESILQYGLEPADNQQDHCVCVCLLHLSLRGWLIGQLIRFIPTHFKMGLALQLIQGINAQRATMAAFWTR